MFVGAGASGWVFLKARGMENKATLKKVKEGHKDVISKAKAAAKRPSGVPVMGPDTSEEEVNMSLARPSRVAKELEMILKSKEDN